MAEHIPVTTGEVGPTTVEGLLADRQHFWSGFTRFIVAGVIAVVVILRLPGLVHALGGTSHARAGSSARGRGIAASRRRTDPSLELDRIAGQLVETASMSLDSGRSAR